MAMPQIGPIPTALAEAQDCNSQIDFLVPDIENIEAMFLKLNAEPNE